MQRALGVDPGSIRTGLGLVEREGTRLTCLHHTTIATPNGASMIERLRLIHAGIADAIVRFRPDTVAVEDVFQHLNAKSAFAIGQVRGVALLAAAQAGLEVHSYPPARVKKVVSSSGRADKAQVARMVQAILGLRDALTLDAADALAVAICHLNAVDWRR